mmetsp:Transcript_83143/g.174056  ORF Transcript_83143/g.174056 Transcript_83143/m.174056 type:complete len:197 (+) Transcript_83143:194-784(+)|eukprot:CAMPEP_0206580882 /NCGR_PEP_ID=MMETSP0325_2-20121206/33458_1 /ASSEMBLY_ACC=CAM_ASM_000347 /TAXON_ID=2866 /ORGANISM="Crypthecodinium cohnii, Strain Seligo" /LENGTH=196 /DNA_ID=CAMNT_0054087067 /DNA_START=154 /DNA_END=744 /DNA_ORIENTATION=+
MARSRNVARRARTLPLLLLLGATAVVAAAALCRAIAFVLPSRGHIAQHQQRQQQRQRWRPALRAVGSSGLLRVENPPPEGERVVIDGPNGPVVVTQIDGEYFAVDATCPHLGLPMKRGRIEKGEDGPTITCNFHNTCFKMKDGKCTKWVTGAVGFESDLVGGVMRNLGGEKKDIDAYEVVPSSDGYLWLRPKQHSE